MPPATGVLARRCVVEDFIEDYPTQTIPGHVKTWTRLAVAHGREYLVATTPMRNWEPTYRAGNTVMQRHTPDAYREMLRRAKLFIEQKKLRRFVSIEAWNEWLEGSHAKPSSQQGLSCLEEIRDMFGRSVANRLDQVVTACDSGIGTGVPVVQA